MDSTLRCNDLKCRAPVPDQAIVTTCSHIFCLDCANKLGLVTAVNGQRLCPACSSPLNNPDDAVCASLNPTEDYKTSILSGLNPTIIMECAGRGLAFWAYQMVQEITYQDYLARSLTERYTVLSEKLEGASRQEKEANVKLQHQISLLQEDNQALVEKTRHLDHQLKEKTKVATNHQNLYNKLKQQQLAGTVQYAADDDAEALLMQASQHPQQHHTEHQRHGRGGSNGSGSSEERRQHRVASWPQGGGGRIQQSPSYVAGQDYRTSTSRVTTSSRACRSRLTISPESAPIAPPTANRQRLPQPQPLQRSFPQPAFGSYNSTILGAGARTGGMDRAPHRAETPLRGGAYSQTHQQSLGDSPNGGQGMSAGMRRGRPSGGGVPLSRAAGHARPSGYSGMMR